jgi:hypothetical protein
VPAVLVTAGTGVPTRALILSESGRKGGPAASSVSHRWKKDLKNADLGPEAFRELRARIPRHTLKPERSGTRRPPDAATYAF